MDLNSTEVVYFFVELPLKITVSSLTKRDVGMPLRTRQTIIHLNGNRVTLNDYYVNAPNKCVRYEVFRDRIRSIRRRKINITEETLERAIKNPVAEYQPYSGSGRALEFQYTGQLFKGQSGKTFPSIKAFLIEVGLESLYSKVKNNRKKGITSIDKAILQNENALVEQKAGVIYKITHLDSGMVYFGLTRQCLKRRWNQHKSEANKGSMRPLYRVIREHGANAFKIETVTKKHPFKKLAYLEREFISTHNSTWPNGLNACSGGQTGNVIQNPVKFGGYQFNTQQDFGEYIERITAGAIKSHTAIMRYREGKEILTPQRIHCLKDYAGTTLYRIWGAKIRKKLMSDEWLSFETFYEHMGSPEDYKSPFPGLLLTRPDRSKKFGPNNYKWLPKSNASITLTAREVRYNGVTYSSYAELSRDTNISASTLIYWNKLFPELFEAKIKQRVNRKNE